MESYEEIRLFLNIEGFIGRCTTIKGVEGLKDVFEKKRDSLEERDLINHDTSQRAFIAFYTTAIARLQELNKREKRTNYYNQC